MLWSHAHSSYGTIPARAGETSRLQEERERLGDHPRSRGGNQEEYANLLMCEGPSPLARGKHAALHVPGVERGTIPARAGETAKK